MKNAFGAATVVAISMLSAGQAFAQAATQDINITATVPGYCRINGSATPGNLSATVPVDAVGAVTTTAIPSPSPTSCATRRRTSWLNRSRAA